MGVYEECRTLMLEGLLEISDLAQAQATCLVWCSYVSLLVQSRGAGQ